MINKLRRWRPLLEIFVIAVIAVILHVFMLRMIGIPLGSFVYSPTELYVYFLTASIVILAVLIAVERRNKDQVGYTFLILTSVKLVGAYLLLRPVLELNVKAEKINFFMVFALFLTFETIVASRMLNREK